MAINYKSLPVYEQKQKTINKQLIIDTITLSVGRDNVKLMFARWAIRQVEDVAIENDSEVLN